MVERISLKISEDGFGMACSGPGWDLASKTTQSQAGQADLSECPKRAKEGPGEYFQVKKQIRFTPIGLASDAVCIFRRRGRIYVRNNYGFDRRELAIVSSVILTGTQKPRQAERVPPGSRKSNH